MRTSERLLAQLFGRNPVRSCVKSLFFPLLTVLFLAALAIPGARADESKVIELLLDPVDPARSRTVPLKIYVSTSEKPQPVILFSHGLGGSREAGTYLGKHWAEAGYVGVFLQHPGSDSSVWKEAPLGQRMDVLKAAASGKAFMDRAADVPFVLDLLEKWNTDPEHPLHGRLDLEHIGMSGHSFGAKTTQAMMGETFLGNRDLHEPRIDAFLPLSPSIGKRRSPQDSFGDVNVPVLCMTGTKDGSPIDPSTTPESRQQVYAALPAGDKYHLVLDEAEHHAFGDVGPRGRGRIDHHHPAIQKISTAFWDAYLKGDAAKKAWLQSEKVREEAGLIAKDVWEWK